VAEELAQESLVRGFRAIGSLADPQKFGPWICGVANRVCLDWLKDKDRTLVNFNALGETMRPEDMADPKNAGQSDLEAQEDLHRLLREVERLPEKHREVLMLFYYEDCTYEELAQMLNVSSATINARLTQARQMLRQRLRSNESPMSGRNA
jgi:RNA polymerase sigma-70 factor (ECF subfamily)